MDQFLLVMGQPHDDDGEGNEGQQRHIVGDQHGGKETESHQKQRDGPQIRRGDTERMGQMREETGLPQPVDHGHQAVEQRQGSKVEVGEIPAVGRNEKAGEQGSQRGDEENGFPADERTDSGHE